MCRIDGATARTLLGRRIKIDFDVGPRKYDSADVTAFHHDPAVDTELPLTLDEHGPHFWQSRNGGGGAVDFRRPYGAGDVDVIDRHGRAVNRNVRLAGEFSDEVLIVERHAVLKRLPSHSAVHGAAVDVPVSEGTGDRASDGTLSGAGRSVDGDDEGLHVVG